MSLASVITTSVTKGSFKQVERHGFDLTQGDARVILQTIRARDIMTRSTAMTQPASSMNPASMTMIIWAA
ncbi:MAG: hypothetical protein JKP95_01990 [Oceanicaulis sp.]|nr:hypothetical protein [Oceanicaulis sp.]